MSPFDKAWSPYAAGILIGLLQIPAFLIIETALGASSSYVTVGAGIAGWSILAAQHRLRGQTRCGERQESLAGRAGRRHCPGGIRLDEAVRRGPRADLADMDQALGSPSKGLRYAVAFAAGFLMLFGARIADGCTSGHGLSGMAQLSVGSTVAVAAMFAGGIATALLLLRRI